jgi:hypothetical protein
VEQGAAERRLQLRGAEQPLAERARGNCRGRGVGERRVRAFRVVILDPARDDVAGLAKCQEQRLVEQLVRMRPLKLST